MIKSIKRSLQIRIFCLLLLIWALLILAVYFSTQHEIEERFDGEISQMATIISSIYPSQALNIEDTDRRRTIIVKEGFSGDDNYEKYMMFQVKALDGSVLMQSENSQGIDIMSPDNAFIDMSVQGNDYRIFTLASPSMPFKVITAQNHYVRFEQLKELLQYVIIALLISFPIVYVVVSTVAIKGLKPLKVVNQEVASRSATNLSAINLANVPLELQSIISSMNALFHQVKDTIVREKRFTSDAAHELRTPLAGLKAQAQIALKDENRVATSLQRIIESVDRTSRMAEQLLSLSRVDNNQAIQCRDIDAKDFIQSIAVDLNNILDKKQIAIDNALPESLIIHSDKNLCYILFRNIIENSANYSPKDSVITIDSKYHSDSTEIIIQDQGPGIAEEKLNKVFDRFYRVNQNKGIGSGLGLSIVKNIATILDLELILENNNGLKTSILFKNAH